MKSTKIQDSVIASLKKGDDDEAQKLAEAIRESWREQATAFNRSVLLMLGLVALFVLLINGKPNQITFLGVALKDTTWLQISIPTLVAYLYLDAVITATRWGYYETAHRSVIAFINPKLVDTGLDSLMGPRSLSVAGAGVIPQKLRRWLPYGPLTELALALMGLVAMGLVPILFQIGAYYHLITRYGSPAYYQLINEDTSPGDILPWIFLGLGLTSLLMLCSFFIWVTSYGGEHFEGILQDFKSIREDLESSIRQYLRRHGARRNLRP